MRVGERWGGCHVSSTGGGGGETMTGGWADREGYGSGVGGSVVGGYATKCRGCGVCR